MNKPKGNKIRAKWRKMKILYENESCETILFYILCYSIVDEICGDSCKMLDVSISAIRVCVLSKNKQIVYNLFILIQFQYIEYRYLRNG